MQAQKARNISLVLLLKGSKWTLKGSRILPSSVLGLYRPCQLKDPLQESKPEI